jgi:hypothetical protein
MQKISIRIVLPVDVIPPQQAICSPFAKAMGPQFLKGPKVVDRATEDERFGFKKPVVQTRKGS